MVSRLSLYPVLVRAASSSATDAWNNRLVSIYLQYGDNMGDNRGEKSCGLHSCQVPESTAIIAYRVPYSTPYFNISSDPSLEDSHQGATLPRGGLPQNSVSCL